MLNKRMQKIQMEKYQIKLRITIDQLQSFIQHVEKVKSECDCEDGKEWEKVRDDLAYELDMITDYPFDK